MNKSNLQKMNNDAQFLTGKQICKRLQLESWDHDGFRIRNPYLHPEKLFTSEEKTSVPASLTASKEPLRSGDIWISNYNYTYLYLGMINNGHDYVFYLLDGVDDRERVLIVNKDDKDFLKRVCATLYYVPLKYQKATI